MGGAVSECGGIEELDTDDDWVRSLSTPGPDQEQAIRRLHDLMRRAAARYLSGVAGADLLGHVRREGIIEASADEATVEVLGKLSSFEGRSRFTTWAYKFAILKVAVEVRRSAWRDREVDLASVPDPVDLASGPHEHVETSALNSAIRRGIDTALTPHQRRVLIAIVIDGVPIDVLADRLSTNRNALYKTLHDARKRLREDLISQDLIAAGSPKEAIS